MDRYFKIIALLIFSNFLFTMNYCQIDHCIVSKDGSGNYRTIQEALDAKPENNKEPVIVFVRNGVYKEKLVLTENKASLLLIGENKDSTIITYDDYSGRIVHNDTLNTHNSCSFRIMADDFTAMNIAFENSAGRVGQAVAVEVNSDRVSFYNCRFIGNQDTYYTNSYGRVYMQNCYIEGTTDFIFGKSVVLFDSCRIHSKKNSYITAASTPEGFYYGYVFRNCTLTADSNVHMVYLGRPWRDYAKVAYLNCEMGSHIRPEGWHNWDKPWRESKTFYAEYNSTGPGGDRKGRVKWSYELNSDEAEKYTTKNIFARQKTNLIFKNDWIPEMPKILNHYK